MFSPAFAGNFVVARFLLEAFGVIDEIRDNNGNTAADCAERSQHYELAKWLRRYASVPVRTAVHSLGLSHQVRGILPPSLKEIRNAYLQLAKENHPDRNPNSTEKWNAIGDAYHLLQSWWVDEPDLLDVQIRIRSRNAQLLDYGQLCWHYSWHQKLGEKKATIQDKSASLLQFEFRLIRLLKSESFLQSGLRISQLPKEYEKNFHTPIPKPREFGCRKLIYLLQKHCPNIVVYTDGKNQALLRVAT